jgi:hypothetical protein
MARVHHYLLLDDSHALVRDVLFDREHGSERRNVLAELLRQQLSVSRPDQSAQLLWAADPPALEVHSRAAADQGVSMTTVLLDPPSSSHEFSVSAEVEVRGCLDSWGCRSADLQVVSCCPRAPRVRMSALCL